VCAGSRANGRSTGAAGSWGPTEATLARDELEENAREKPGRRKR